MPDPVESSIAAGEQTPPLPAASTEQIKAPPPAKKPRTTKKLAQTAKKKMSAKSLPPERILVIDNGGDTLKFGWNDADEPQRMANITARLPQQWAVLVGDQLQHVKNPNQLICIKRSTERGIICDMGNMVLVWKRLLDLLGVAIPQNSNNPFGCKVNKNVKIPAGTCGVLLVLPPLFPRSVLNLMTQVWLEDFGFAHVGFCVAPTSPNLNKWETTCRVDLGWSSVTVIPSFRGKVIEEAIRRVPLGGRHLVEIYKYYASYRYYNLPDFIVKDVMEQLGYVARDLGRELAIAQKLSSGRRPFDREYVLPDYQTYMEGRVRLPPTLQKQEDEEEEEDGSFKADASDAAANDDDIDERPAAEDSNEMEEDVDSDNETLEEKKRRLLRERAEEERRKREEATEEQVLQVSTERFCVPEALFQPCICQLPKEWAGVHNAIVQAIQACPEALQIAMYRSIFLVGGLVEMEGLVGRLKTEVRSLTPCEYDFDITVSDNPVNQSWRDAARLSKEHEHGKWSISYEEWEASKKRGGWERLLSTNDGYMV